MRWKRKHTFKMRSLLFLHVAAVDKGASSSLLRYGCDAGPIRTAPAVANTTWLPKGSPFRFL